MGQRATLSGDRPQFLQLPSVETHFKEFIVKRLLVIAPAL
jgi:hypothetical protein